MIFLVSCLHRPLCGDEDIALFLPVPASGAEVALETRSRLFDHLNKFFDWLMSFQNLIYQTEGIVEAIAESPEVLQDFEKEHGFFAKNRPLVGQYTPSKDDIKIVEEILAKVDQIEISQELRKFYIQEILSKVLAYRQLDIGDSINIPDLNRKGSLIEYKIDKIFNLGFSMPAFALTTKAQGKPSIVLFRGTHLDLTDKTGVASIIADLDLFGPGYTAFFKIEEQLRAFFINQEFKKQKTMVMGYSLGGILSVYTATFFSKYIDFDNSAAFNPPGVQKKLFNLCITQKYLKSMKVYVNQYDPVSKWGFLIGNVEVLSTQDRMGPLKAHTVLMGSQNDMQFSRCNLSSENKRHRYLFLPE